MEVGLDRTQLMAAMDAGLIPKFVFFWGHRQRGRLRTGPWCFSQWWSSPFEESGYTYPTAEHFIMAQKAALFGDEPIWQQIMETEEPGHAKALVEASPHDRIWGIGMAASDPASLSPHLWRGDNLLGFVLMEVRALLRNGGDL